MEIAIAGAGIAGLTMALLLSRAGQPIHVFERAENLAEVGAGLQISPNAGRILDLLGLGPALDRVATRPVAIDMRSAATGRIIVSLPLAAAALRYGAPYRLIHRADLQAILLDAVAADPTIQLTLAAPVTDIEPRPGAIAFRAGGDRHSAELLVGADGVRSTIRQYVAGSNPPQPTGRTAWRTTIAANDAPEELPRDRTTVFLGDRNHVVVYPIRSGAQINVVAIVEETWQSDGWSESGDADWLNARFRSSSTLLQETIEAGTDWTRWCLSGVDPSGPWARDHAVLVGDAAHAMLPFLAQGAAMAIEDAAILARTLTHPKLDIDTALARYETLRRPRVARVWNAARQSGGIYHMSPLTAPFRDATMKTLGGERLLGRYDWIYGWRQGN